MRTVHHHASSQHQRATHQASYEFDRKIVDAIQKRNNIANVSLWLRSFNSSYTVAQQQPQRPTTIDSSHTRIVLITTEETKIVECETNTQNTHTHTHTQQESERDDK